MGTDSWTRQSQYRGVYLDAVINLEGVMSEFIAKHFCGQDPDKENEFTKVILYSKFFPMALKLTAISFILKNYHKEVLTEKEGLLTDVESAIELRNEFAHKETDSGFEDGIKFLYPSTKRGMIIEHNKTYSLLELSTMITKMIEFTSTLCDIMDKRQTDK